MEKIWLLTCVKCIYLFYIPHQIVILDFKVISSHSSDNNCYLNTKLSLFLSSRYWKDFIRKCMHQNTVLLNLAEATAPGGAQKYDIRRHVKRGSWS